MALKTTEPARLPGDVVPDVSGAGLGVIVGRQAVVDADQRVVGYELLQRNTADGSNNGDTGEFMTAADLIAGPADGTERLVGGGFALCAVDARAAREAPVASSARRIVLRPSEPGLPMSDLIDECRLLSERGYRIAVDLDAVGADSSGRLAGLASIVTVPVQNLTIAELSIITQHYRRPNRQLLATGVDGPEAIEACRAARFDYLQGYAVPSPRHTPRRALEASRFGPVRLAASLLGDAFELAELENILRIEPAMTYQLLRLAGAGADNGMRRQLRSIREALVLIGSVRLQSWVALLLLRGETDDQAGAISIALGRARMCEILVRAEDPKLASLAFTAGILSAFDLLLGLDMHDIAAELSLDETLREAAFGSDSRVAQLRHDVTEYQAGRIEGNQVSGLTDHQLDTASMAAIRWAEMAAWTFADSALA
jgi:c-di-GMP-related signal transduction protein